MERPYHIDALFKKLMNNECSPQEVDKLISWLTTNESRSLAAEDLIYRQMASPVGAGEINPVVRERLEKRLQAILQPETPVLIMRRTPFNWRYKWWAAAAVIIILFGPGLFVLLQKNESPQQVAETKVANDVLPGKEGAILTLSNGKKIILDSLGNGIITTQGNTAIKLKDGRLLYDNGADNKPPNPTAIAYNTVTTPKGRQYQLILPDGTKAWLNAASSLHFPVQFTGRQRQVEITGEVYFEVAKNVAKPFHVNVNGMDVQVLGTHFNINSYKDELAVATTLLEGSVKVNNAIVLSPGQQSQLEKNGRLKVMNQVDTDEVISWKNGIFSYSNADISMVMRQVERWYDIEVVYEGKKTTDFFTGSFPRTASLQQVLKMLQLSRVHFKLEGKRLTVSS